tara:strand:- start:368 stop:469 length:102 start_codon:yes stop_codon:yes gene_type:complete
MQKKESMIEAADGGGQRDDEVQARGIWLPAKGV